MYNILKDIFMKVYQTNEIPLVYFAPGRVNLIGEHTDYNGGHVFPCAITLGTYCAIMPRQDKKIRLYSHNFEVLGIVERNIEDTFKIGNSFSNYPVGVVCTLKKAGYKINQGFDMVIYGNLPNSSGLSSSASIEILVCYALSDLFDLNMDLIDMAKLCQKSENEFNGVNCGIMDQFAIAMGKKNHAIFLDTATLEYKYLPLKLDGVKIVIACSNKKRGLGDSKYNERRAECEKALSEICAVKHFDSLGDMSEAEFEKLKDNIKSPVRVKRARHAVYENQRTIKAVEALKNNDLSEFGSLMKASHISLRDDYEVTGKELDALYDAAVNKDGVIGTRMTGAGFGGCSVSLVKEENVDAFIKNVGEEYKRKVGYEASFYVVTAEGGPRQVTADDK